MMRSVNEIMAQVAGFLDGWDWVERDVPHSSEYSYRELRHIESGAVVGAWSGSGHDEAREGGRIEFYPIWPRDEKNHDFRPDRDADTWNRITVSADRTPESIAKDIARRLLPGYVEMYLIKKAERDEWEAKVTKQQVAAVQWAAKFGTQPGTHSPETFHIHHDGCSLTIEISIDGGVRISRYGWLSKRVGAAVLRTLQLELGFG